MCAMCGQEQSIRIRSADLGHLVTRVLCDSMESPKEITGAPACAAPVVGERATDRTTAVSTRLVQRTWIASVAGSMSLSVTRDHSSGAAPVSS